MPFAHSSTVYLGNYNNETHFKVVCHAKSIIYRIARNFRGFRGSMTNLENFILQNFTLEPHIVASSPGHSQFLMLHVEKLFNVQH